ncbi:MAG: DEAD/DEAH box helicase, partial [Vulcanisaeta sp.]
YSGDGKALCGGLRDIGISELDDYQAEMIGRLIENLNRPKMAIISAPTGSGKTLIFMAYVILKLLRRGGVAVIIYPTKALAREQLEFMLNLLYSINAGSGRKIHTYIIDGDSPRSIREVRNKRFRGGLRVRGGTLQYDADGRVKLTRDGSTEELIDWVSEVRPLRIEEPAVVITNHAMLSLHLNKGSQWVKDLLSKLSTIVIDEAHIYMNNIELLNVLHFLITRLFVNALIEGRGNDVDKLSVLGGIRELINEGRIDLILSSATLGDRRVIDEGVSISQLGGVNLAALKNNQKPNLKPLLKWLLDIYGEGNVVYVPYYDAIMSSKAKRRLVMTVINFPIPSESAQTPFIEGLASAIIWSEALSRSLRRTYGVDNELHALAFMDNKTTQQEVFNRLIRRGIQYEAFHADKLLVSPLMDISTHGKEIIEDLLRSTNPLTDQYLSTYSHLQLFYDYSTIKKYVDLYNGGEASIMQLRGLLNDAFEFAKSIYESRIDSVKFLNSNNGVHYVMLHNASLEMTERSYVENVLRNGRWRLVTATSTLELGVNIPGVALVIQYGSPPSSESFIQRVGRAGRDNRSLRISSGSLFMKSVGRDISYIDETQAFKSLFNLEQPRYPEKPDRETLIRFMGLLHKDLSRGLSLDKTKT